MVEAAGVEPASENARHEATTCVARFRIFDDHLRTGKSSGDLARLISVCCSGQKLSTYPAK